MIDELLKTRGIEYLESGKDYLVRCLNPEHEDRNPSMRIDQNTGIFNCLSCGYKGNIFELFGEKPNGLQIKRNKLKAAISQKMSSSVGLEIPVNAVPFDQEWRGISADTFKKFEAFTHNDYAGRLVFPIRAISGKIIAFCGRHQGMGIPKYMFSPRGTKLPLFPIVKPIRGRVIIVEGIFDMLNLHDKGLTNAICAFGVNKVDNEKLNILKIQGVSHIDIFYDTDEAGRKGAAELRKLAEHQLISTQVVEPTFTIKDPGELTAQQVIAIKKELYGG